MASSSLRRWRPGADDIEESNSTANLFLGGVRRNWMSGSKNAMTTCPQARARKDSPSQTNSASAADPHPKPGSVRSAPADAVLMSPGSDTSQSASTPAGQVTVANVVDKPGPPPAALPSPVPSTGSVSSPVVSYNHPARLHDVPDAALRASNSPAISAQPATSYTAVQTRPSSRPGTEQDARQRSAESAQMPPHVGSDGNHVQPLVTGSSLYQDASVASTGHSNANVRMPAERRLSQSAETGVLPSEETWRQWRASLEQLKREVRNLPGIAWPRVMLLDDALVYRDLHYLLLHQLYCRRSVDIRLLYDLPVLQQEHYLDGMENLTHLIESNTKLSEELCWKLAEFPFQLHCLRHEAWLTATFQEVLRSCYCLTRHPYGATEQRLDSLYIRGYPPLVEELLNDSEARSPVLLNVIFASACRRLYDDDHLPTLNKLFRKDLHINSRLPKVPDTEQQRSKMLMELIEHYKQIPMKSRPGSPLPHSPHPAPSVSQTQTMPMHVTMSPSTSAQSSVVNPTVYAPANPNFASNSPQGMMVPQNPGYFQYQYSCPPQQAQIIQHWQTSPDAQPQTAAFYSQVPTTPAPPLPQGQRTFPTPGQFVTRRQSQPAHPGQAAHLVHSGQAQWYIHEQRHPSIPHATSPSVPSQLQRPSGQAKERPTVSPREAPSPATQRVSTVVPRLLPPDGYRVPPTSQANPMRLGLHQADLRDPVSKLIGQGPNGEWVETELYHFANDFLLAPQFIDRDGLCYDWSFDLSEEDCCRFPLLQEMGQGQRSVRTFQSGCRTFRLRSVSMRDSEEEDPTGSWFAKSTTWPSVFYIFVNGVELFVRRKAHNGKDLPLDITKHLKKGENKVTVHFLLGPDECKEFRYAFGIERMVTTKFEHVRKAAKVIPADETYQVIRKRLTPSDDDDIAFITDSLTINLIDPFTAKIFKTPVRSMFCSHLECFDLDTFIRTRKSESGPAPLNDNWHCPICHADARPQCLRINSFLILVREELIRTQRLEVAQAIQVKADGTWSPKLVSDDPPPSPPVNRTPAPTARKRKASDLGTSRPKTEGSPDRNPHAYAQGPVVIELE